MASIYNAVSASAQPISAEFESELRTLSRGTLREAIQWIQRRGKAATEADLLTSDFRDEFIAADRASLADSIPPDPEFSSLQAKFAGLQSAEVALFFDSLRAVQESHAQGREAIQFREKAAGFVERQRSTRLAEQERQLRSFASVFFQFLS